MSSQDVIKSTAKKLKYYMEVKRLEDSFDLSGPDKPQRHYPTLKPRPTLLYDGLHDRSLKHYFHSPEVKKHMTQMKPRGSHMASEEKVRRDVDRYIASTQYTNPSYSTIVRPKATSPKKRHSNFRGGPLMMRSKHGPYLSKGETERLVNTATKLLVASETIPIENGKKNKKYRVYAVHDSGVGGSLPIIEHSPTYPPRRPDRPHRPKTSRGSRPKSAISNPSAKRYGYDKYGQQILIRAPSPPNHYEASESDTEDDDGQTNILVPVRSGGSQTPEWLNLSIPKGRLEEEEDFEEEESFEDEQTILQNDMALTSYDNCTQTGVETAMQTVELIDNTKDTQTRRANTVEALTDPWQAEISMQTEPPPITSSTQTVPPPPEMSTQTIPPPPEMSTQTIAAPPEMSTQTPAVGPAMATQTLPEMSTQTIPEAISTQTETAPPEVATQITPDPSSEEEEEEVEDYDHLRHGPRLKSGKRSIYEMAIHTGSRLGASTRADVSIILYGEKGNTGKIKLKQSKETKDGKKMKFQKGQIDVFKVESFYVGKLECVTIGHDRRELGCGWFVDKIMISEYGDDITYEFVVERWLSAQDEDGRTVRTLPVTNIIMDVSSSEESGSDETDFVERSADSSTYTDTDMRYSQVTDYDPLFASDGGSSRSGRRRKHRRRRAASTTTATETGTDTESDSEDSDATGTTRSRGDRTTDHSDSSGSGSGSGSSSGSSSGSETEGGDRGKRRRGRDRKGDGDSDHEQRGGRGSGYYRGGWVGEPQHSEPLPTEVGDAKRSFPKSSTPITSRQPSPHPPSTSNDEKSKDKTGGDFMSGFMAGVKAREEEEKKRKEKEEEEEERKRQEEERLMSGPSVHDCCKKGDIDRVKQLITFKGELKDTPDERGWTPLHCAAASGKVDIVKWLIVNDVNVNMLTPTGYSGIHQASMNGHMSVMMVLAAMGVDVNSKTVDQQTPLHLAAMSGHLDCCKWLVANKACEDCEDIMGRSALDLATEYQHSEVETFLKSCRKELKRENSSLSQLRSPSPTRAPRPGHSEGHNSNEETGAGAEASNRPITPRKPDTERQSLNVRQRSFHQQQEKMSKSGMSFLDSIRAEYEDTNQEQVAS